MFKLPSDKQTKKIRKKAKTIDDILDCTKGCTHFPYGCFGCTEQEIYGKKNNL